MLSADLPQAIARCSLEHFIAAENSVAIEFLKHEIGEDAAPLARLELDAIITELLSG
jgi:hypothetical protein